MTKQEAKKLYQMVQKEKEFKIEVCRTGYAFTTITVVATDRTKAEELALEEAGSHDFNEKDCEYSIS